MTIKIGDRKIGNGYRPFILAEMSGNHNQSIDRALELIELAVECGCDGIKIQTYTPETMTLDLHRDEFVIKDKKSLWYGSSLYDLYKKAMTPWEWHKPIFDKCKSLGIICFSTPFDITSVDFLEGFNLPAYKVASFENTDHKLLARIAQTGKPVVMSTGMSTLSEIDESVKVLRVNGCKDLILLKCTSTYPASPSNSNIKTIPYLKDNFKAHAGLSDHTLGIGVAIASVALGAVFIEKHFTKSREEGGVDSQFSMEPMEMKSLCEESKRAWESLGQVQFMTEQEVPSKQFRRSLYITKDLKKGELISECSLRSIRPGLGLEPKYYDIFIGKAVNKAVEKGTPLTWELIG